MVAAALILQGTLVAPAALRLAAASSWDAWAASAICAAHAGQPAGQDEDRPLAPAHNHEHCAICGATGLAFLATSFLTLAAPVLVGAVAEQPWATGPPPPAGRYEPYASRAPPAAA